MEYQLTKSVGAKAISGISSHLMQQHADDCIWLALLLIGVLFCDLWSMWNGSWVINRQTQQSHSPQQEEMELPDMAKNPQTKITA